MFTKVENMTMNAEAAQLMDTVYRNQRHFYDFTRKYYLLGRDRLIDRLEPIDESAVLELGCGTGRNLIAAARRYPNVRFYGVDISEQMLETAWRHVKSAGLSDRIHLGQGDASDPRATDGFGLEVFDRVFYSYTLSMIPVWQEALVAGLTHLAVDGRILVVDFGQQERLPSLFKSIFFAWLSRFHVSPRADMNSVLVRLCENNNASLEQVDLWRGYAYLAEINRLPSADCQ